MPERLAALILSMLAWDPAARPTAQEALADEVWEQADEVKEQADEAPSGLTRTSSDGGGGGAGGDQSPGATRLRRSDGPPPSSSGSGSRLTKRTRRSDAPSPSGSSEVAVVGSGSARPGGRVKRMKRSSSQSLPSPPPE
ncbi:hypothetical protein M406DRAFT_320812 [Cryphonectria parasitica EP155]|uniref:Protein kinase domain-containing protein n=1 Tax=Cryphonectria parasitica (strain ATCC 38755 / EP155) TaxID=660469 RepID=A0A9P5CS40_CRYP1|nr:uncharacterized protein M406DRAFT_320812 [Cryphonectria parasitica EP155]KAF3768182.1 hypothetical protein M406DRAFT_320812 [Cryphonectria parasitica EP155]